MEKMSIAEAMQELKLLDKRFDRVAERIERSASKKQGEADVVPNQKQFFKEEVQSFRDSIKRYTAIKLAIQKANLENGFDFNDKHYTLSEAILYKQYIKDKLELFLNAHNPNTANIQLGQYRMSIQQMAQGKDNPNEILAKANLVPELMYDEKAVIKEREDLAELMAKINVMIDKVNHNTLIEF